MTRDFCSGCNTEYDWTPETARLFLFIETAVANHIEGKCPACGKVENTFSSPWKMVQHVKAGIPLLVYVRAADEFIERAEIAWASVEEKAEPDPPREWLRSVYDTLRDFERGA